MVGIFSNRPATIRPATVRPMGGVLAGWHDEWADDRRYLTMGNDVTNEVLPDQESYKRLIGSNASGIMLLLALERRIPFVL